MVQKSFNAYQIELSYLEKDKQGNEFKSKNKCIVLRT